jgi:hypothetical protein
MSTINMIAFSILYAHMDRKINNLKDFFNEEIKKKNSLIDYI